MCDREEQRKQGGGRRDDDVLRQRPLEQRGVLLLRGLEQGVVRQVHHDEFGAFVEPFPVGLPCQLPDVLLHLRRVIPEPRRPRRLVRRLRGVEVRAQRRLGVDQNGTPRRHPDDHVGPQRRPLRGDRHLFVEVAVLGKPGELDHAAQVDLGPPAAVRRRPQGRDQRARVLVERVHLLPQRRVRADARLLQLLHVADHLVERLPHRRDQVGDGLLPLVEIGRRALAHLLHGKLRDAQELVHVGTQGVDRERLERLLRPLAHLFERLRLFLRAAPLRLQRRFQRGGARRLRPQRDLQIRFAPSRPRSLRARLPRARLAFLDANEELGLARLAPAPRQQPASPGGDAGRQERSGKCDGRHEEPP